MPNFEENESTANPSTTYDVNTTCDDTAKSTKSDAVKDENPLDKVTTDETKDENKRQEKNSLQREVSVDALSSKTVKSVYTKWCFVIVYCFCRQSEVTFLDKTRSMECPHTDIQQWKSVLVRTMFYQINLQSAYNFQNHNFAGHICRYLIWIFYRIHP